MESHKWILRFKLNKKLTILFAILSLTLFFLFLRNIIFPIFAIFTYRQSIEESLVEEPQLFTQQDIETMISEINSWELTEFENFKLRMPVFEVITDEENMKEFKVSKPETEESINLIITREETALTDLTQVEPENEEAGYTLINKYDALRIGPKEIPYDNVTYYILNNGYLYIIEAKFNSSVALLDEVLSTFEITN